MNLVILSRSVSVPSTRLLVEAARARGHHVRVLNPARVELQLDGQSAYLFANRKRLKIPHVVLPRVAPSLTVYGLSVIEQFAMRGALVMNDARALGAARNPMRVLQLLSINGIGIPRTVMARDPKAVKEMIELVGGVPALVKLLEGHEKRGVVVCETLQSLEATLEAVFGLGQELVVQEYVKARASDVRVLVVGGSAVAAVARNVKRTARTTLSPGRSARFAKHTLSADQQRSAERCAALLGLEVCTVDMLDVKGVPKVFDVNASPALNALEAATGLDLATPIIARAEALAAAAQAQAPKESAP